MSVVSYQFIHKDQGVEAMLRGLDTRLSPVSMAGFLGSTGVEMIQEHAEERFAAEGDEAVGDWLPLAPATVQIREEAGYGGAHPINVRAGQLADLIMRSPGTAVPETGVGASVTYPGVMPTGTLLEKMMTAQGGNAGGGEQRPTPARPVLALGAKDAASMHVRLALYLMGARR